VLKFLPFKIFLSLVFRYGFHCNPFKKILWSRLSGCGWVNFKTPWWEVLLEKFVVTQLVNKFPAFMEPEGSVLCSQKPANGPNLEPNTIFPKIHFIVFLQPVPLSSNRSLPLGFSSQNVFFFFFVFLVSRTFFLFLLLYYSPNQWFPNCRLQTP
jgi:hypothetical protein